MTPADPNHPKIDGFLAGIAECNSHTRFYAKLCVIGKYARPRLSVFRVNFYTATIVVSTYRLSGGKSDVMFWVILRKRVGNWGFTRKCAKILKGCCLARMRFAYFEYFLWQCDEKRGKITKKHKKTNISQSKLKNLDQKSLEQPKELEFVEICMKICPKTARNLVLISLKSMRKPNDLE